MAAKLLFPALYHYVIERTELIAILFANAFKISIHSERLVIIFESHSSRSVAICLLLCSDVMIACVIAKKKTYSGEDACSLNYCVCVLG